VIASDSVRLDMAGLRIVGVGRLTRADPRQVRWLAEDGAEANLIFDAGSSDLHYAVDSARHLAIVASDDAAEVYALDATRGARVRLEQRLHRFDDPVGGLRYLRLVGLANGALLLYEHGLSRFNEAGWLQWRVEHYRVDWWFDHIDAGTVWLHDQEKPINDPDRTLVGYRLEDGTSVVTPRGSRRDAAN
jgi:hypothetical protein